MAYDKVIDSSKLDSDLTSVADAIRRKGGTTAAVEFPAGFVSAIEEIAEMAAALVDAVLLAIIGTGVVE